MSSIIKFPLSDGYWDSVVPTGTSLLSSISFPFDTDGRLSNIPSSLILSRKSAISLALQKLQPTNSPINNRLIAIQNPPYTMNCKINEINVTLHCSQDDAETELKILSHLLDFPHNR